MLEGEERCWKVRRGIEETRIGVYVVRGSGLD